MLPEKSVVQPTHVRAIGMFMLHASSESEVDIIRCPCDKNIRATMRCLRRPGLLNLLIVKISTCKSNSTDHNTNLNNSNSHQKVTVKIE